MLFTVHYCLKNLFTNKPTISLVMAWCLQVPSHYLSQCSPLMDECVTRDEWVNDKMNRIFKIINFWFNVQVIVYKDICDSNLFDGICINNSFKPQSKTLIANIKSSPFGAEKPSSKMLPIYLKFKMVIILASSTDKRGRSETNDW